MQPGNPYHLIEAVGSCQVGSVWSAIDPQGRSLMVALLDPNVATDQRWREAFQEAANALVQAGEPGYMYADFASGSPWVAYSAENGIGAERVFLALGMDFQPVPPDGLGPLDYTPAEPTTQVTPAVPAVEAPPPAPAQPQPLPPDVIDATAPTEAPPTTILPPVQAGPAATEPAQPPAAAQPAPDHDDFEATQPTHRMQLPPTAQPAPFNPWAADAAQPQSAPPVPHSAPPVPHSAPPVPHSAPPVPHSAPPVPPQAQSAPVSPPPVSSAPPHPVSGAPQPVSGGPSSAPPHPTSGAPHPVSGGPSSAPPHPTSGAPGPVSGTPMSPAYGQPPLSPAYGQPAPAYGPRPPQGPAPYDPYAPVAPPPRRSRSGLWIGIAVAVLVLIAGGGGVYAWTASGGDEPTPPVASASTSALPPAPLPTASPLFPGIEPPRKGTWPAQWPKFAATDSLRTLSNLDGLGFTLKVPRTWDCSPAGRAEGFAKYNCGATPGAGPELGGELIVRDCPDGCSAERRATMRQAEEAWGLRWVQSGEYSSYAESSSLQIEGEKRYGLVVVAYWRSGSEGSIDRQIVFRMTAPVEGAGQLRRVANYIRDTVIF